MRRSSEDLELSCDETVLLDADDDTKRQYADLLLKTAGDEQCFTTCLSASALRCRLKSVVEPKKKPQEGRSLTLIFDTPKGTLYVTLSDRYMELLQLYGRVSTEY